VMCLCPTKTFLGNNTALQGHKSSGVKKETLDLFLEGTHWIKGFVINWTRKAHQTATGSLHRRSSF